jgi:hypothetical protein
VLVFGNGQATELSGKTALRLRAWHHVVFVRAGRRVAVYLNGNTEPEIVGEADVTPMAAPQFFFGGRHDRESTLEGKLDDIAVFDRALTADEIAVHYRASGLTPPKPVPPPKTAPLQSTRPATTQDLERYSAVIRKSEPLAWWTLHEAGESAVPDATGHGHQAVLEPGATARRPGSNDANFTGGRLKATIRDFPREYSVEMWIWNELPIGARAVTGYFFSPGGRRNRWDSRLRRACRSHPQGSGPQTTGPGRD